MSGVNKAIIIGHLGRDPETRTNQANGRKVVTFSVATGQSWRDKTTGERKEKTHWHNVVIFNQGLAEVAEKYLKKGAKVYLEGSIETRKWTAQDNTDRYTTEIVLRDFGGQLQMLDRAERPAPNEDDYGASKSSRPSERPSVKDEMDDEIPF